MIRHTLVAAAFALAAMLMTSSAFAVGVTKGVNRTQTQSKTVTKNGVGGRTVDLQKGQTVTLGKTVDTRFGSLGKTVTLSNDRNVSLSTGPGGQRGISVSGDRSKTVTNTRTGIFAK